jgi:hypothetical protein
MSGRQTQIWRRCGAWPHHCLADPDNRAEICLTLGKTLLPLGLSPPTTPFILTDCSKSMFQSCGHCTTTSVMAWEATIPPPQAAATLVGTDRTTLTRKFGVYHIANADFPPPLHHSL